MGILGAPGIYRGRQLIAYGQAHLTGNESILNNTSTAVESLTNWDIEEDIGGFFLPNKRIDLGSHRAGFLLQATMQCSWGNSGTGTRQISFYSKLGPVERIVV